MSATQFDKSIGQLAREAASDLSDIVTKEVRLGRAEITEKLEKAAGGLIEMMIGAAILIPALTLALIAAAYGLSTIDGLALWAAALIVAVVAGLGGYLLILAGKNNVEPKSLFPQKTVANVKRDAAAMKEAL